MEKENGKFYFSGKRIFKWLKRITGSLVCLFLLFLVLNFLFPLPDQIEYSKVITDRKGNVLHIYLTRDEKWRMKTGLEEISPLLKKAILAKEDRYFYNHPGINPFSVCRALVRNLLRMKRTSGASTITMQVARALEPGKRTYSRKIREMFRALQLEWKYPKDVILQLYLNLVPYGGNIEGVKSASLLYFDKSPDHLSLAEITALGIIPNRPSSLVIGRNNDRIVSARNQWLQKFAKEKLFSAKEIEDALSEPLTAYRHPAPAYLPHLSQKLRAEANPEIHTSIEWNTQQKTEKLVADYIRSMRLKNIHQAAVIVLDNRTHEVIAYVGSSDYYDTLDAGQVNGASAVRQPGSTLKPLLYGLCIDAGLMTPKSVISDVAVSYGGYSPENYDRQFSGYVTMEYALEHSLNIPAVKSLRALGKERLIRSLSDCGFRQIRLDQRKLGLSMILGGCGASLEELTGLYSAFARGGEFVAPRFRVGENTQKAIRILSPAACYMLNETLSKVNRPDFPLSWQSTEHMPRIAWKTGTSYGRRDAWSIGYNLHYTIGVWVGNFSAIGVPELSGANIATPLLFKIFNSVDYDTEQEWFKQPSDCDIRRVCSETGMVPGAYCSSLVTDYFIPLVSATQPCNNREEIMVSPDEKISYCQSCAPATGYRKKVYKKILPDMQQYFEEHGISYEKIPVHNPSCEKIFREGAPSIISPRSGSEYLISRKHPEPLQLACQTGNDVSQVYWYIGDRFYKACDARSRPFFIPPEGPVKISCTDDKGRNRNSWIRVRYVDL